MTMYFFDLDGTLTDSQAGLIQSFRAGVSAIGAPDVGDERLRGYLGTPLPLLFKAVQPGITAAGIAAGIAAFRRHYDAEGIQANLLYPGVRQMLLTLRNARHSAWIVTSKPQPHAERVAAMLELDKLVDGIVGAGVAEMDTKTELVAQALAASGASPARSMMLGDRSYDVIGAQENGVEAVGALWGYGSEAELRAAGCTLFAASPGDFQSRFVDLPVPAAAVSG